MSTDTKDRLDIRKYQVIGAYKYAKTVGELSILVSYVYHNVAEECLAAACRSGKWCNLTLNLMPNQD